MVDMSRRALALVAFFTVASASAAARADVISNEEGACQGKAAGDACDLDGKAGRCATSTCSRNDYSDGPPPKQKQVECLLCDPAAKAEETPAKTDPKATTVEPTKAASESKQSEVPTTRGCANASIASPSTMIGSSVLGLVLLGLARRGRSRR
jgi:hypothetical protein